MELRTTSGAGLYDKWGCLAPEAPKEVARLSKNHEKSKKIAKNRLKREIWWTEPGKAFYLLDIGFEAVHRLSENWEGGRRGKKLTDQREVLIQVGQIGST
jgi:hypothetical protein